MKTCSTCRKRKSYANFYKNRRRTDGVGNRCKPCMSAYGKAWYANNAQQHKKNTHNRRQLHYEIVSMLLIWYLLENPCVDCGEADPVVLHFDHVTGDKVAGVSWLKAQGYSLAKVVAEVAKCEVRCANCHARQTARRSGAHRKLGTPL